LLLILTRIAERIIQKCVFRLPGAVYESEEELESESEEEREGKNFLKACDRMFL
jgi:hypothetical protein